MRLRSKLTACLGHLKSYHVSNRAAGIPARAPTFPFGLYRAIVRAGADNRPLMLAPVTIGLVLASLAAYYRWLHNQNTTSFRLEGVGLKMFRLRMVNR
ncbi:hypothetical protein GUJ93_ZPchr0012g19167 [Zizania palustris]|uniref:Uncharacterized protein n=1 Tax=Zizania palustris TaxID=103762 RepID=A0A8J5WKK4_ZIZPA|nr:hypothetical protein GUJ93_ZPchr0012g19167 [Zizania palustris]